MASDLPLNIKDCHDHEDTKAQTVAPGAKEPSVVSEKQNNNGSYFAYASIPMICFAWLSGMTHFVAYLQSHEWYRNPLAVSMELLELESESTQGHRVINAHVFLALSVVILVTFQVGSTFLFSKQNALRMVHGAVGRVTIVVWTVVSALGAAFTVVSDRWGDTSESPSNAALSTAFLMVLFWSIGVATVINMGVGYFAVAGDSVPQAERDYVLHKGSMFFGMFWILGSAFDEVAISILQLIMSDCNIGIYGILATVAVGQTVQIAAIAVTMFRFDYSLLSLRWVRLNLLFLGLRTLLLWIATIVLTVNRPADDSCWGAASSPS